jgi:hypothetical protein
MQTLRIALLSLTLFPLGSCLAQSEDAVPEALLEQACSITIDYFAERNTEVDSCEVIGISAKELSTADRKNGVDGKWCMATRAVHRYLREPAPDEWKETTEVFEVERTASGEYTSARHNMLFSHYCAEYAQWQTD